MKPTAAARLLTSNRVSWPTWRAGAGPFFAAFALLVVVGYLVVPPLLMLLFGAATDSPPATEPHFTWHTILSAYGQPVIYPALVNSIVFAALTATISLSIGAFVAWATERTDARIGPLAELLAIAPILMPGVLLVTSWVMLLGPKSGVINLTIKEYLGLTEAPFDIFSFAGMVWVAVLQELPLAFLWLWPAFRAMSPDYEEAALTCGASFATVIRRITLPILRPTLLSAWIIFFVYSLGALSVPLLIGLPAGIFLYSTEIYLASSRMPTDLNLASAYSLLFLATTVFGLYAYRRATRESERFVTVRGRAFTPRLMPLGWWRHAIRFFVFSLFLLTAGLPFAVLAWNAFMPFPQAPSLASLHLFTTSNFAAAWNYGPAQRAFFNSLVLGFGAGLIATVIGALVAWCTLRLKSAPRLIALLDQVATAPIAIPGMIVGVSLLWFYLEVPIPIYGTPWILLIAYVTLHLPFAVRICSSGLSQIHAELEEAARVSGASMYVTFRRVVVLLVFPSLLASALYVALRSFREYAASIFLAGPGTEVFAVLVLDMTQSGNSNILAAYTTTVIVVLAVAVVVFNWLGSRVGIRA